MSTALQLVAYTGVASDVRADEGIPGELTNSGMFPKAWRAAGDTRFLYKAGHVFEGANVGKEPYSEYLASQIARCMEIDAIAYDLAIWNGKLCSTCELFNSKNTAFVPFGFAVSSERFKNMNLLKALAYFADLDEQAALVIGPVQKAQLEKLDGFEFGWHPIMEEFPESDTRNFFSVERLKVLERYIARRTETLLALPTVDPAKIERDIS